jgi:hypothetical protein
MPSSSPAATVDPREEELRKIEARLAKLFPLLENKHTPESVQQAMENAESLLEDHTPMFVRNGGGTFEGTRHVQGLIHLQDALQLRIDMGTRHPLAETRRLLERKIALLRELHNV